MHVILMVQQPQLMRPLLSGQWLWFCSNGRLKQGKLTAGYDRVFGKHAVSSSVNLNISAFSGDGYFSYKYNYLNYNGNVNYNYDNRYIGQISFSYFETTHAPSNRWAFYPAVSGAWIVSNEDFMKDAESVDFMKVRASADSLVSDSNATGVLHHSTPTEDSCSRSISLQVM